MRLALPAALAALIVLAGCGAHDGQGQPSDSGAIGPGPTHDGGTPTADGSSIEASVDTSFDAGSDALPVRDAASVTDSRAGDARGSQDSGGGIGGIVAGGVRWVGRVDASNPSAVKFAWSGTGFVATVSGTKLSIQLQTEGATSSAFFQPVIDGVAGQRFQVMTGAAQTVVIASALAAGDHTVELYRESEGMFGDTVFSGFVDGTVKGIPGASGRLIEIIGDSISAGYGNLGTSSSCTFSLDTQSAYQAYGSILARSLNAEVSIIARSGWGMVRDLNGSTSNVLSSVYGNTLGGQTMPQWDFRRQADAVVINLGTNDSAKGDPGQPYEDAYVAFLQTIRGHYPNASIFLTIGPMTSGTALTQMRTHLANVASRVGDSNIVTVDIATQNTASTGCDYHPNVGEDTAMAGVLTTAIQAKLGW
jgi:lysophospholipase L1-like esterase